jgi:hypothetical protein
MHNQGESMRYHDVHRRCIWVLILLMAHLAKTGIANADAASKTSPAKMKLGVLERRLTQLRPLFEYSNGKWQAIEGDSQWDFDIVPQDCRIVSEGKAVAQLKELLSNDPVRNSCKCADDLINTLILDWTQPLPPGLLKADALSHPLPVVCGDIKGPAEEWSRANKVSEALRMAVAAAFLRLEPQIHVCQQDPKILMGADPNQRELDIKLKPQDLVIHTMKSKQGAILAEVSPKYYEMCGKPSVFTGRWLFLSSAGQTVDLGHNLKLESYADFNGDSITDFLFSIYADGADGYVVLDGKTLKKSVNNYYYK